MSCEKKDQPVKIISNSRPVYVVEPTGSELISQLPIDMTPVVAWIVETSCLGKDRELDAWAQPVIPGNILPEIYALYDAESKHWEVPSQAKGKDLLALSDWFIEQKEQAKNSAEEATEETTGD